MRISLRSGKDISSAKVGDHLALRFEIEDEKSSPYEIFVRELVASDGVDTSEILLIDDRGKDNFFEMCSKFDLFFYVLIRCKLKYSFIL